MGIIRERVALIGRKSTEEADALFDTGCTHSLMSDALARRLGPLDDLPEPAEFEAAVGHFKCHQGIFVNVQIGKLKYMSQFRVAHGLTEDVILGLDFMQVWNIKLDPRRHMVVVDPKALKLKAIGGRAVRRR